MYDFTTQTYYPVSPYDCSHVHRDCPRLFVLGNQYLIIQDANHDLALDTKTNFSLIINISSGITDILAILHSNIYNAITSSPPIIHSTTSEKVPSNTSTIQSGGHTISAPMYTSNATLPSPATVTVCVHGIDSSSIAPTSSPGNHGLLVPRPSRPFHCCTKGLGDETSFSQF